MHNEKATPAPVSAGAAQRSNYSTTTQSDRLISVPVAICLAILTAALVVSVPAIGWLVAGLLIGWTAS